MHLQYWDILRPGGPLARLVIVLPNFYAWEIIMILCTMILVRISIVGISKSLFSRSNYDPNWFAGLELEIIGVYSWILPV